jgi:hypothetical protein
MVCMLLWLVACFAASSRGAACLLVLLLLERGTNDRSFSSGCYAHSLRPPVVVTCLLLFNVITRSAGPLRSIIVNHLIICHEYGNKRRVLTLKLDYYNFTRMAKQLRVGSWYQHHYTTHHYKQDAIPLAFLHSQESWISFMFYCRLSPCTV